MNRFLWRAVAPGTLATLALFALSAPVAAEAGHRPAPGHHASAHAAQAHAAHPPAHGTHHAQAHHQGHGAKSASGRGDHHPTRGHAAAHPSAHTPTPAPQTSPHAHAPAQGGGLTPAGDPPGNNGTVKIKGIGDLGSIPNNVAHPGCAFQVMWYGFDEGTDVVSTVSFAMQAPTADVVLAVDGPTSVFVGGDPATGAGTATGLDGAATYHLSFDGAPQAKQGYHVRLTVSTPYAQGNETKTKVFWVSPCTSTSGPGVTTSGPTSGTAGGAAGTTGGQVSAPGTALGSVPSTLGAPGSATLAPRSSSASSRVVAEASAGVVPTAVDAGTAGTWSTALHTWHGTALPLLLVALGLGTTAVAVRRRHAAAQG